MVDKITLIAPRIGCAGKGTGIWNRVDSSA